MSVVRHRNRFPRESVDVPSLEVFKVLLEWAWNNLVYCWNESLLMAVELELGDFLGPFQP